MYERLSAFSGDGGFNGAATNWSRKFTSSHRDLGLKITASMGPRPIGRGNRRRKLAHAGDVPMLQWGRDQLVAEIASL
jgi:hypothetical protein